MCLSPTRAILEGSAVYIRILELELEPGFVYGFDLWGINE